jgi:hypothetical protein
MLLDTVDPAVKAAAARVIDPLRKGMYESSSDECPTDSEEEESDESNDPDAGEDEGHICEQCGTRDTEMPGVLCTYGICTYMRRFVICIWMHMHLCISESR